MLTNYEADLDLIIQRGVSTDDALMLANWPDQVRGFGPIRTRAAVHGAAQREKARSGLMA
jgi:indolepyruvate ferredoxin oxidoreductase